MMKVSGFTFIRNACKYDYPIIEAIQSILPICDEVVVALGNSDDATLSLLQSIHSSKIKIIHTQWDETLLDGGRVLAEETNKALQAINPDSDWAFYIQGDEVLHEKYLPIIYDAMTTYQQDPRIDGLLLHYCHFYGSYDYIGNSAQWYHHEIRIIKTKKNIYSYRDAQGFRKDNDKKLQVKLIDAYMYHYGWVREPKTMTKKQIDIGRWYHNNPKDIAPIEDKYVGEFDYYQINSLAKFEGTHPNIMQERIKKKNWQFEYDISKPPHKKDIWKARMKKILKAVGIDTYYENYILVE